MRLFVLRGTILERKLRWSKITFRYLESEAVMPSSTKHSNQGTVEIDMLTQNIFYHRPFNTSVLQHKLVSKSSFEGWHRDELLIVQRVMAHDGPEQT